MKKIAMIGLSVGFVLLIIGGSLILSKIKKADFEEPVFVPTIALRKPTQSPTSTPTPTPTPKTDLIAREDPTLMPKNIIDDFIEDGEIVYRYDKDINLNILNEDKQEELTKYIKIREDREIILTEDKIEYFDLYLFGQVYVPETIKLQEMENIVDQCNKLLMMRYYKEHPEQTQGDLIQTVFETQIVEGSEFQENCLFYNCLYKVRDVSEENDKEKVYYMLSILFYTKEPNEE